MEQREVEELKAVRREFVNRSLVPFPDLQKPFIDLGIFQTCFGAGFMWSLSAILLLLVGPELPSSFVVGFLGVLSIGVFVTGLIGYYMSARVSVPLCSGIVKVGNTMEKAAREEKLTSRDVVFRLTDNPILHRIAGSMQLLFEKKGVVVEPSTDGLLLKDH